MKGAIECLMSPTIGHRRVSPPPHHGSSEGEAELGGLELSLLTCPPTFLTPALAQGSSSTAI